MKRIESIYKLLRENYNARTFIFAALSILVSLAFIIYNAVLGIVYSYTWNGCICIYYFLLFIIRGIIVMFEMKNKQEKDNRKTKKTFLLTSGLTVILNLALIAPITLLVLNQKPLHFGLIPSIAMAAYATYKIVMGVYNFKKTQKSNRALVRELRMINLIDALVSIITLQNTLIMLNEETYSEQMLIMVSVSSGIIFVLIIFITVFSFITTYKGMKKQEQSQENLI